MQSFLLAAMGVSAAALGASAADHKGETLSDPVRTGFLYDEIYLRHHTGAGHPERPERLTAIVERLRQKGLLAKLIGLKPVAASTSWLTTVHSPEYVERVRQSCRAAVGYVDTPDAPASTDSYEVALAAVGGVQCAIDAVMAGKINNAFCAVRPPGHHALTARSLPLSPVLWQASDGSRVLAFHTVGDYNQKVIPEEMLRELEILKSKHGVDKLLILYGQGDHGGGPMPDEIPIGRRAQFLYEIQAILSEIDGLRSEIEKLDAQIGLGLFLSADDDKIRARKLLKTRVENLFSQLEQISKRNDANEQMNS